MSSEIQIAAEAANTGALGTLGINLKIFIAQLINFGIVLLVLWKWAYKPVVKLLEERQEKIEKGVKQATQIEQRLIDLEKEQQTIIATAKKEGAALLDKTRVQVDERKKILLEKTKGEVKTVIAQGKMQLQAQKEQMILEARQEIAQIAIEATRKILSESVDEKKAQKLAESVFDQRKI